MKNKFTITVLLAVLLAFAATGTAQAKGVSEAGVLFLKISPGARAGGMGEAFVALADDATATWWNPAGLAYVRNNEVTLMHSNWLPQFKFNDLYYDFLSYVHMVDGWGTFGTNVIFLNLGESIRTDETGRELGTFNSYEMALTGSYGSPVTNDEKMAVGVNMRFIYSNLSPVGAGAEKGEGTATSVGVDIGWFWYTPIRNLQLGANLSNMGPPVAYIDRAQADPLPTNLKVGFAYHVVKSPYNTLTLVGDFDREIVYLDESGDADPFYLAMVNTWSDGPFWTTNIYHIGAEYWYTDLVGLRAGYWNDELGKVKPLTFGASLKYSLYRFDFSYVSAGEGHPLQDTMRFSLSIGF